VSSGQSKTAGDGEPDWIGIAGVGSFASEAAETTMLAAAAVIAVVSLTSGCCHHRQWQPIALMLLGFGLVAFGKWFAPEGWPEVVSVVAGAGTLASAHLVNLRACALSRVG
jgi:hypothetical protein